MHYRWKRYVRMAERRFKAARAMDKLQTKGHPVSPVIIEGRTIASTFWGKAWCANLERYGDYSNRLPRGRTYVRNGSVVDLQIGPGEVNARVAGSSLYRVKVVVAVVPKARWAAICRDCSGAIDSLVELLQGRFSAGVMERICRPETGLFPSPREIRFECSCPDWARMCKHVAAVLYGIGSRLDESPALLFHLRKVDENVLIARAGKRLPLARKGPAADKILGDTALSELFGIEMTPTSKRRVAVTAKPSKGRLARTSATRSRAASTSKRVGKPARAVVRKVMARRSRG